MNLQENMMSNKDLVLKLINIQYYLMRYGRTHTNWHETLNEVIVRLYDDGRKVFPRLENASNAELIQTLKDIRDYMHFDKDSLHRSWNTVLNTAIMRLKGAKAPENVSESVLHMLLNGVSVRDVLLKKGD